MNRLLLMGLSSFCLLILTGCYLDDDHKKKHKIYHSYSHAPTIVVADTSDDKLEDDKNPTDGTDGVTDIVTCEAPPGVINKFIRIQLTYGLLDEGAYIPGTEGESGGLLPLKITAAANQGATEISVDSTASLVNEQLLTYLGTNGRYSVGQIQSLAPSTITLKEPLLFDLAADDSSLWNFYDDEVHANEKGFKAIADFAYNNANSVINPDSVHLLLGDSWFKRNGETPFEDRLLERLPSGSVIKNEGIGGHSLCSLLGRVDTAIDTHNPNYVWINSSINDFFDGVTQQEYKDRMQTLIGKIQAAGATAIVMDPAPGMLGKSTDDGRTFTTLSRRYATQILNLLAETEATE